MNTNQLITVADLQFCVTLKSNGMIEIINLENNKKNIYSSIKVQSITIGKSEESTISFPNNLLLSDMHLSLIFCLNKRQWMVQDISSSDSCNNKSNQTKHCWMLSDHPYPIYSGLICKINSYSFEIDIDMDRKYTDQYQK